MKYNFNLYGRIVIAGILALIIRFYILVHITSNYLLLALPTMVFTFFAFLIGYIIFNLLEKRYVKYINKKSVNIFCILLVGFIVFFSITEYYTVVPPKEIINNWKCTGPHELCNEVDVLWIQYYDPYVYKEGGFRFLKNIPDIQMFKFIWQYDRLSKEITLFEPDEKKVSQPKLNGWKIKLKLEITVDNEYYNMITYYINSNGKTPIDAKLFDSVTWTTGPYVESYYKGPSWPITNESKI